MRLLQHRGPLLRQFGFCLAFAIVGSLACGCSSKKQPQLKVYPTDTLPFIQKFPLGYIGTNEVGEQEIILISEGLQTPPSQGKILYPTSLTSIRQVVHMRILYNPLPGTRTDQPSATNANISWYVRSNMPGAENDKIDYGGAGFVNVYPTKTGAQVRVRNAELTVRQTSGDLENPFGKPTITGTFNVVRNDGIVRETLAAMRTKVASR